MSRAVWDAIATAVVSAAALIMLGFYLHDRAGVDDLRPRYEEDWRKWGASGIRIGSVNATMVIDVFVDFACPHCLRLTPVLDSVLEKFPHQVAARFQHFPLRMEGRSVESAKAIECATEQGRFRAMYGLLSSTAPEERQSIPWGILAAESGVGDLTSFRACIEEPLERFERVIAGRDLAERLGLQGTPTVWVNGRVFDRGRSMEAFLEKAEALGIGNTPTP